MWIADKIYRLCKREDRVQSRRKLGQDAAGFQGEQASDKDSSQEGKFPEDTRSWRL